MKRLFLFLPLCLFAAQTFFNEADIANGGNNSTGIFQDDALHNDTFDAGTEYIIGGGKANITIKINATGQREITINQTQAQKDYAAEFLQNLTQNRTEVLNNPNSSTYDTYRLKQATQKYLDEAGLTPDDLKKELTDGVDITSTNAFKDTYINASGDIAEQIANATKLYTDSYGDDIGKLNKDYLKSSNANALINAFSNLTNLQNELTKGYSAPTIQCQISRKLIPAFKCGLKGKNGLIFGGNSSSKTNADLAQSECNDYCRTDLGYYSCEKETKLGSKEISLTALRTQIYPNFSGYTKNFTASDLMPVNTISLTFIANSSNSNLTQPEIEKIIEQSNVRLTYSVVAYSQDDGFADNAVVNRAQLPIRSSKTELVIPINQILPSYYIQLYQPLIANARLLQENNITISLASASGEYASTSWYYCPKKQYVSYANECGGSQYAKKLSNGKGYVCTGDGFKIGKEPTTGAFYDEDSCLAACVVQQDCAVTYEHYSASKNSYEPYTYSNFYEISVDCVDDDSNTECTKAKCEAYLEQSTFPISESVVSGDNDKIVTISSGVATGEPRPKIDFNGSIADLNGGNYTDRLNNELKDAAYLYMIEQLTLNKLAYKIGETSPHRLAYTKNKTLAGESFWAILKPKSSDINNGKTYNVYLVARVDSIYTAKYGMWYVTNSQNKQSIGYGYELINAMGNQTNVTTLQFKDYTYLIQENDNWHTFRKEEFAEYLLEFKQFSDNTTSLTNPNSNLSYTWRSVWLKQDNLAQPYFAYYDSSKHTFKGFGGTQQAKISHRQTFDDSVEMTYLLVDNSSVLFNTDGVMFYSQTMGKSAKTGELDERVNPIKHYDGFSEFAYQSNPADFSFWLVYSQKALTYDELMREIEGDKYNQKSGKILVGDSEWGVYNMVTPKKHQSGKNIADGVANNNINPYLMGEPHNTSLMVDFEPGVKEKGKKVYKFVFIKDD